MAAIVTDVRYDGSSCLNVRSIISASETLAAEGPSPKPLTWNELWSVLWFVETSVTSRRLFFDGTVPGKTAAQALTSVHALRTAYDVPMLEVTAIKYEAPEQTLDAARKAMAESRRLVDGFELNAEVDKPIDPAMHEKFFTSLLLARESSEKVREELALKWVWDAFTGSKCLAALIANGDEAFETAYRLYERAANGALVTAALINRFRLNYVNELAAQEKSAYVPDPTFEALTKQDVRLFQTYLLEKMIQKIRLAPEETNLLVDNLKSETPLPPIGLFALMATSSRGHAGAILERAYEAFRGDSSLMEMIWRQTRGGIPLKDSGELNDYFYSKYAALAQAAEGIKPIADERRSARTYLVPAVVKGLLKAVPATVGLGGVGDLVYSILIEAGGDASVAWLGDRLLGRGCDSYISQYKRIQWNLEKHEAVSAPLGRLADQVEKVFGRPLVP